MKFKNLSKVVGVTLLLALVVLAALTYWHPGARTTQSPSQIPVSYTHLTLPTN